MSMPTNAGEGGDCQPGYYCPGGSPAPINCTEGYYCATTRLASPTAQCNQGKRCATSVCFSKLHYFMYNDQLCPSVATLYET